MAEPSQRRRQMDPAAVLLFVIAVLVLAWRGLPRSSHEAALDGIPFVTELQFDAEVVQAKPLPVLVEFWASWCSYCREMEPVMQLLKERFAGRLKVVRMDYDDSPVSRVKLGIGTVPVLLMFRDGRLIDRANGALTEDEVFRFIARGLNRRAAAGDSPPARCVIGPLDGIPICE